MQLRSGTVYEPKAANVDAVARLLKDTSDDKRDCIIKLKSYLNVIMHLDARLADAKTIEDKDMCSNAKLSTLIDFWDFMLSEEAAPIMCHNRQYCNMILKQCNNIENELKGQRDITLRRSILVAEFNHKNRALIGVLMSKA